MLYDWLHLQCIICDQEVHMTPYITQGLMSISFYLIAICPVLLSQDVSIYPCYHSHVFSGTQEFCQPQYSLLNYFLTFPMTCCYTSRKVVHVTDKSIPGVCLKWNMLNNYHCLYIFHSKTYSKFGFEKIIQTENQYCFEIWIVVIRTSLGLSTFHSVDIQY